MIDRMPMVLRDRHIPADDSKRSDRPVQRKILKAFEIATNYIKGMAQKLSGSFAYIMQKSWKMAGKRISIGEKIECAKGNVTKAKAKQDAAVGEPEKPMTRKREMRKKEWMNASANRDKSYEEIMRFLNERSDSDKLNTEKRRAWIAASLLRFYVE